MRDYVSYPSTPQMPSSITSSISSRAKPGGTPAMHVRTTAGAPATPCASIWRDGGRHTGGGGGGG